VSVAPSGTHAEAQALAFVPSSEPAARPPEPPPSPPPLAPLPPPLPVTPLTPAGVLHGGRDRRSRIGGGQHCASALDLSVLGTGIRVPPLSATGPPHTHDVHSVTERAADPGSSPD
jgi:hypothetical protein